MFQKQDIISAYTRARALADGVLVDATASAAEAGFRYPVALTRAAWEACVAAPPGSEAHAEADRLWDVLQSLIVAIRRGTSGTLVGFAVQLRFGTRPGPPQPFSLQATCGPGDDGWPCITVMMPNED